MGYQSKYKGQEVENILDNALLKNQQTLTEQEKQQVKENLGIKDQNLEGYATKKEVEEVASKIPTNTSELTNDSGFLTEHQSLDHLATKDELKSKQDVISDLANIREGAAKGATALQSIPDEYITASDLDKILLGSSLEFVDLELPSGNLWATCNIGASKPEEAGLYFAWGETNGYRVSYEASGNTITSTTITDAKGNATDRKFLPEYYKWCEDEYIQLTKYNNNPQYGKVDNLTKLQQTDDAAYAESRNCRIPSVADFEELLANTKFSKVAVGNRGCGKFTAPNGNYVIFPAVGSVIEDISGLNIWAVYPTSELDSTRSTACKIMYFTSSYAPRIDSGGRGVGIPVRAVTNRAIGDDGYYTKGEIDDRIKELESIKDDLLAIEISEVGEVSVIYGEKSDFVGGQIRETGELVLEFNIE